VEKGAAGCSDGVGQTMGTSASGDKGCTAVVTTSVISMGALVCWCVGTAAALGAITSRTEGRTAVEVDERGTAAGERLADVEAIRLFIEDFTPLTEGATVEGIGIDMCVSVSDTAL
jgi:hypothetical protein